MLRSSNICNFDGSRNVEVALSESEFDIRLKGKSPQNWRFTLKSVRETKQSEESEVNPGFK